MTIGADPVGRVDLMKSLAYGRSDAAGLSLKGVAVTPFFGRKTVEPLAYRQSGIRETGLNARDIRKALEKLAVPELPLGTFGIAGGAARDRHNQAGDEFNSRVRRGVESAEGISRNLKLTADGMCGPPTTSCARSLPLAATGSLSYAATRLRRSRKSGTAWDMASRRLAPRL